MVSLRSRPKQQAQDEEHHRDKAEVVIHDRHNKIRDKDSYGNDACPPKDRRH